MIRKINTEDLNLSAIKHQSISEFELLLPDKYSIIYSGVEWCYPVEIGEDLHLDILQNPNFKHLITIVNHNPKPIKHYYFNYNDSESELIEFKKIVDGCTMACITLNDDNTLNEIMYCYVYDFGQENQTFLFEREPNGDETEFYFAREEY